MICYDMSRLYLCVQQIWMGVYEPLFLPGCQDCGCFRPEAIIGLWLLQILYHFNIIICKNLLVFSCVNHQRRCVNSQPQINVINLWCEGTIVPCGTRHKEEPHINSCIVLRHTLVASQILWSLAMVDKHQHGQTHNVFNFLKECMCCGTTNEHMLSGW